MPNSESTLAAQWLSIIAKITEQPLSHDACRLFHGRGGLFAGFEHISLDWYPPVLLLTSFKPLEAAEIATLTEPLHQHWRQDHSEEAFNLVYQCRFQGKHQTVLLVGSVSEPHIVEELGARYQVHLLKGQNHGLFLDMRNARQWVKENAQHCKVLNLFSYTCSFSIAALLGGADEVINMDMSKGALSVGKQNHLLNDLPHGARFYPHDIFNSWGKLNKMAPFELIIIDPPSNQKDSFVATKDYGRLLKRIHGLKSQSGKVLVCLNAPELSIDYLKALVAEFAPELIYSHQLENPKVFNDIDVNRALKVLVYC